jgi:ABC-type Zn uptake system ZnuABC Zn-binding protein ZnuA
MAKQDPRQQQLRPEVAEKYTATITPCVIEIQRLNRTIDLRTLTLEEADVLVQDPKFTYLVAKRKRKAPAAKKTND